MCAGLRMASLLLLLGALVHGHDTDQCAGAQRAPLRISPPFTPELNALRMVYPKAQNFSVRNAGNRLALEALNEKGLGFVDYHGKRYTAELADFRSPAEHVLGTTRPPVELQMYHHTDDGRTLAVSLLFRVGASPSKFVDQVLRSFDHRRAKRRESPVALLDFGHFFRHSSDYFAYSTVGCGPEAWGHPPMDRWIILSKMKQISTLQLQRLRKIVPQLSRTTRSLSLRQVTTELVSTKAAREGHKHISAHREVVAPAPVTLAAGAASKKEEVSQPVVPAQKDELPWISTELPSLSQISPSMAAPSPQVQPLQTTSQISLPQIPSSVQAPQLPALIQPSSGQAPEVPAQPVTVTSAPQITPEELNMVSVAAGAPDDLKIPLAAVPPAQQKRPVTGLLQQGTGAKDSTATEQDPSLADPLAQASLGVSPTFVPPPPFYNDVPTAAPDGYGSGSYSRPQPSLMLTDADLSKEYKKGFNAYEEEQPEKNRMVSLYPSVDGTQALPSLDALAAPISSSDLMPMPNLPMAPPDMPMGGMMGGGGMPDLASPSLPGVGPGFSLIQRQQPNVNNLLAQNDEALKKHFGSQGLASARPSATLIQGQDAGLADMQHALAGSSADLLMQQQQYQQWVKQTQAYQSHYGTKKTGVEDMKNRLALWSNIQQQQQAMDTEIKDAMQQPYRLPSSSAHKGKNAKMIRVQSNMNNAAKQKYLAQVATRERSMWAQYHNLEDEQKELKQMQATYQKAKMQADESSQLYDARSTQDHTLWKNFAKPPKGPPGFFLGA